MSQLLIRISFCSLCYLFAIIEGVSQFQREINSIPIIVNGANVNSFISGAQNSKPSFADIDNDGDFDLFLGGNGGSITFFRNLGTASEAAFSFETDNFADINAGFNSSPSFADIDGDQDLDLFIGEHTNHIHFYRNIGTATEPIFGYEELESLSSITGNAPVLADIDHDGAIDLIVGTSEGRVYFYRNTGTALEPTFSDETLIADAGDMSSPAIADLNYDGNPDLFVGNKRGDIRFYRNVNNSTNSFAWRLTPIETVTSINFGFESAPAFVDIDKDGDVDLFVGEQDGNLSFYRNTGPVGTRSYTSESLEGLGSIDVGSFSKPALADMDDDGDLDLFVGESGGYTINYFENIGDKTEANFMPASIEGIGIVGNSGYPALVDIDGDGDLDLFAGEGSGRIKFYRNIGTAAQALFELVTEAFLGLDFGSNSQPAFVDMEGDGDMDMLVAGTVGIYYYRNIGSPTNPIFTDTNTESLASVLGGSPTFADIDGDGSFELFLGQRDGRVLLYENTGTGINPVFTNVSLYFGFIDAGDTSSPALADIDNDGDLDVFSGNKQGRIRFYHSEITIKPFYELETKNFAYLDLGNESTPTFADLDRDGDFDLFVGERDGNINFFRNNGTNTDPIFIFEADTLAGANLGRFNYIAPVFVDIDNDNDLDLFAGERDGRINLYRNISTDTIWEFIQTAPSGLGLMDVGSYSKPTFADIDTDGDFDMLLGESIGNINFYRNVGTPTDPVFSDVSESYFDIDVGSRSAPVLADINNDTYLDLFIGEGNGNINLYHNSGIDSIPAFSLVNEYLDSINVGFLSTPTLVDIDHDGDLDLFVGEQKGGLQFYRNISTTTIPAGIVDLKINSVSSSSINLSWTAPEGALINDIRFSTSEISEDNWESASHALNEPASLSVGELYNFTLTGLPPNTVHYVAMKTSNFSGLSSALSNVISIRTSDFSSPSDWDIQTISGGEFFSETSLAVDQTGKPATAYGGNRLFYASYEGGDWQIEPILGEANVHRLKLSFDKQNNPHISYYDPIDSSLQYIYKDGFSWHTSTVVSSIFSPTFSMSFDSLDKPHIVYYDASKNEVSFAHFNEGVWEVEIVSTSEEVTDIPALGFDRHGIPHIYYDAGSFIKHLSFEDSSWMSDSLPSSQIKSYSSLLIDENGLPHITFHTFRETCLFFDFVCVISGPTHRDLSYAHFNGTEWSVESIHSTVGSTDFLFLDTLGNPYIIYHKGNQVCTRTNSTGCISAKIELEQTRFAHKKTGVWQSGLLAEPYRKGLLAWDGANAVHQMYLIQGENQYAVFDSTEWQEELIIDEQLQVGKYPSIALTQESRPFISYYDETQLDLKMASLSDDQWQVETIDSIGDVGLYTSLAFNEKDYPNISYYDASNGNLKLASFNGLNWEIEFVDSMSNVGKYSSLRINSQGFPSISYYDETVENLKFAQHDGSHWQLRVVDSSQQVGKYNSLFLNSENQPLISYYDEKNGDLKYASFDGSTWNIEKVDSLEDVGSYSSLSVNLQGLPSISYYDSTNGNLKLAKYNGSNWYLQTIDSDQDVGKYSSLFLNQQNQVAISYYDEHRDNLRFASFDGTLWRIQTVDTLREVGKYSSLVLNREGSPYISYYQETIGALMSASNLNIRVDIEAPLYDSLHHDVTLAQNYPNPFRTETTFNYQIPAYMPVKMLIYNLLGQKVATLIDTKQRLGNYSLRWDGKGSKGQFLENGIYVYILQAGSIALTRKLMIIK